MKLHTVLVCTAALGLAACSSYYGSASGPRYVPRPAVVDSRYTQEHVTEDYMDRKSYRKYEQRELCQRYRSLPRRTTDLCDKSTYEAPIAVAPMRTVATQSTVRTQTLLPIINSYTILFDFDKSNIRPGEQATIDQVVREMEKYNPQQVTVTGYTDSAGKADYNQTLSRKREQAVSSSLRDRGIENQTIERDARGEYDQAIETPDGTKNQQNRRVVIDFRR